MLMYEEGSLILSAVPSDEDRALLEEASATLDWVIETVERPGFLWEEEGYSITANLAHIEGTITGFFGDIADAVLTKPIVGLVNTLFGTNYVPPVIFGNKFRHRWFWRLVYEILWKLAKVALAIGAAWVASGLLQSALNKAWSTAVKIFFVVVAAIGAYMAFRFFKDRKIQKERKKVDSELTELKSKLGKVEGSKEHIAQVERMKEELASLREKVKSNGVK